MNRDIHIVLRILQSVVILALCAALFSKEYSIIFFNHIEESPLFILQVMGVILLSLLHGIFMLVFKLEILRKAPMKCSWWGIFILFLGMAGYFWANYMIASRFLAVVMTVLVLFGYCIAGWGWLVVRYLWFSIFILLFAIPLPRQWTINTEMNFYWIILPYFAAVTYAICAFILPNLFVTESFDQSKTRNLLLQDTEPVKPEKGLIRLLLNPSFAIAVAVVVFSFGLRWSVNRSINSMKAQPTFLGKPLAEFNEEKLLPYTVHRKQIIENELILESLGTREYLQWILENKDVPSDSPVRYCSLFITFYPQSNDAHHYTPDMTYVGGGNKLFRTEEIKIDLSAMGNQRLLDVSCVIFEDGNSQFSVMYFFMASGDYASTRSGLRDLIAKGYFDRQSYFSKIEWKYFGQTNGKVIHPEKQQVIDASEILINALLPVLENEHWPKQIDG